MTIVEIFIKHKVEENYGTYGICKLSLEDDLYKKCIELESQLKEVSTLNDSFPNGLGDYEWKIIENFNSKNFMIAELETQLKERDELLERIFHYHISHGFGDDGSFESFADEITDLI